VVDLELFKVKTRVLRLDLRNERFYLITMAAAFTIEIIPGDRLV
jgi:hypothetical protein